MENLPNEILLHIFQYLAPSDILSASATSTRFEKILRGQRKVSFHKDFSLPNKGFKLFFKSKIRRCTIRELNITGCFWIPVSEIAPVLKKLPELHTFFAGGSQFRMSSLPMVLPYLPKLRRLSVPCTPTDQMLIKQGDLNMLSTQLAKLQVFYMLLYYPQHGFVERFFFPLFRHWQDLQELWIVSYGVGDFSESAVLMETPDLPLPQLHTCVLGFPLIRESDVIQKLHINELTNNWKTIWLRNMMNPLTIDSSKLSACTDLYLSDQIDIEPGLYPNVSRLKIGNYADTANINKPDEFPNVEHFSCPFLKGDLLMPYIEMFTRLQTLQCRGLTIEDFSWPSFFLAISLLSNLTTLELAVSQGHQYHKVKLGVADSDVVDAVQSLVHGCPKVSKFSLEVEHADNVVRIENANFWTIVLPEFTGWTELRELSLREVNIKDGSFFTRLAEKSPNVQSIVIFSVGKYSHCTFSFPLAKAISKWKNLKHFRLRQRHMTGLNMVVEELAKCRKLEFVILDHHTIKSTLNTNAVVNMVREANRFTLLYLRIGEMTHQMQADLKRKLKPLHRNRLCFQFLINPISMEEMEFELVDKKKNYAFPAFNVQYYSYFVKTCMEYFGFADLPMFYA